MATTTRSYSISPGFHARYNRDSVERALTVHFGDTGEWQRAGAGYTIGTAIGIIRLRSLREAYLFVVACAEKDRLLARKARA